MRRRLLAILVPLLTLAMATAGTATAAPPGGQFTDVIVVLHDGADAPGAAADAAREHGARVGFVYEHALQGFSASVPSGRLAALERDARVAYVQPDREVSIAAQTTPTGLSRIFANTTELDIDQTDDQRVDVDVAVIDTGVDFEHPDLDVVGGVTCASGGGPWWRPKPVKCDPGGDDDHYHGTHVAGTIGALDNGIGVVGVAPGARIWAVKVLNAQGSGSEATVVAGIDWVTANAGTIEVANMSLGGAGFSQAEYDAIQGAVNAGVAFAVAAGNDDSNALLYSPGGFDNVLSVSALADFDGAPGGNGSPTCRADEDDTLANFSNWGAAIDVAAPGVCITSTYPIEQGSYGTISGTSMASPHVAGALGLLASNGFSRNAAGVQGLYDAVTSSGNFVWTDDSGDGIHEPLLDISTGFAPTLVATSGGGGGGGGGNTAPVATITSADCSELTCTFSGTGSDADGDVLSYSWTFGDGSSATGTDVQHTYAAGGTYEVVLTVDDGTDVGTDTTNVSPTEAPEPGELVLEAQKGNGSRHRVTLTWNTVGADNIYVYKNGLPYEVTSDTGTWTDRMTTRGSATYTYYICDFRDDGSLVCSNTVTVVF